MHTIFQATEEHIPIIRSIAEKTWWPTYSAILSTEQIRYMLDTIYAEAVLKNLIESGAQTFLLLTDSRGIRGFAAYGIRKEEREVFKLHKLYVLPEDHGKGYGRFLIKEVARRVKEEGGKALDLNVNRHNPATNFYSKLGFKTIREEDVPIGEYWMNDYVMRMDRL